MKGSTEPAGKSPGALIDHPMKTGAYPHFASFAITLSESTCRFSMVTPGNRPPGDVISL